MTTEATDEERDVLDELHALASAADELVEDANRIYMRQTARHATAIAKQLRAAAGNQGAHATPVGRAYIETAAAELADMAARIGACAHALS